MRRPRSDIYRPEEIAVVHVMAQAVRKMYLFGFDSFSKRCFDYRRSWIEEQLIHQSKYFGIELLANAIMSNHFHLVLCSRPDVVQGWSDTEVAYRWLHLCPKRKGKDGKPLEPTEKELDSIRLKPGLLAKVRLRLSDISWWMRIICQKIAQKSNCETEEVGRFFNGRFKAVRLLDDAAILACCVYVDLNPIRAGVTQTVEDAKYTSIYHRIKALNAVAGNFEDRPDRHLKPVELKEAEYLVGAGEVYSEQADDSVDESKGSLKEMEKKGCNKRCKRSRCSDKGFLDMSELSYIELLDVTARMPKVDKPGVTPPQLMPVLERLKIDIELWRLMTQQFGRIFSHAAGAPESLVNAKGMTTKRPYHSHLPLDR